MDKTNKEKKGEPLEEGLGLSILLRKIAGIVDNQEQRLRLLEDWIAGHKADIEKDKASRQHILRAKEQMIGSLEGFQKSISAGEGRRTDAEIQQSMEMYQKKLMDMIKSNLDTERHISSKDRNKDEDSEEEEESETKEEYGL